MSPRSLLFSSDQETSRQLTQALYELEFNVDHCTEIFAAVEKITTQSYDLIVADWDDGLEASFLLKTCRELKANRAAVTVAVAGDAEASAAARQVGAGVIVKKPVITEEAKYTLLSSDEFLRGIRNWLPKLSLQTGSQTVSPQGPQLVSPPPVSPTSATTDCEVDDPEAPSASPTRRVGLWPYLVKGEKTKSNAAKPRSRHWPTGQLGIVPRQSSPARRANRSYPG